MVGLDVLERRARDGESRDRRRGGRVALTVPVDVYQGIGAGSGFVSRFSGESTNLSVDGTYVHVPRGARFVPGELVRFSITVPTELRRHFPFSRIIGTSRVVRVDEHADTPGSATGLALAFCEGAVTMLAAIIGG